jgi:hypothetical protein
MRERQAGRFNMQAWVPTSKYWLHVHAYSCMHQKRRPTSLCLHIQLQLHYPHKYTQNKHTHKHTGGPAAPLPAPCRRSPDAHRARRAPQGRSHPPLHGMRNRA